MALRLPGVTINKTDKLIEFPAVDGEIAIRSADDPESLIGEGLSLLIMDECARIHKTALDSLAPSLIDRKGNRLLISTPRGHNWYWKEFVRGYRCPAEEPYSWEMHRRGVPCPKIKAYKCLREECPVWRGERRSASFVFSSYDNPHLDHVEIDELTAGRSERWIRQEIFAEFLEDGAGVFRHVESLCTAKRIEAGVLGRAYVIGVDWGRQRDATVFSVMDVAAREQVRIDRLTTMGYQAQLARLRELHEKFGKPLVIAEANAMGMPLIEQLTAGGMYVEPFHTTASTKANAVDALALATEESSVTLQDDETLRNEMLSYESHVLPAGGTRYAAPDGMHDDCVMATLLSWYGVARDLSGQQIYAGGALSGAASMDW